METEHDYKRAYEILRQAVQDADRILRQANCVFSCKWSVKTEN